MAVLITGAIHLPLNEDLKNVIDAYSAGTHPKGLDPLAVQVMAEVGVDLSTH